MVLGLLVVLATVSGILITVHHRRGQIRKFEHIDRLEEVLGLHQVGLLDDVHPPEKFRWVHSLNPAKWNTPLFILRMHFAMMIFTLIYVVAKFTA